MSERALGWDLPAGCSDADIDRRFGDPRDEDEAGKRCEDCGKKICICRPEDE